MTNTIPTCSHCNKALQNQTCFACHGNGYSQEFLLIHKECHVCKGSGKVWRCEDEFKHIVDDFKDAHKVAHKPSTQIRHKEITPAFSQHSTAAQQIPAVWPMHAENPWNPNNGLSPIKTTNPQKVNNPGQLHNRNNPVNRNPTKK